jgi:hypothetical protein
MASSNDLFRTAMVNYCARGEIGGCPESYILGSPPAVAPSANLGCSGITLHATTEMSNRLIKVLSSYRAMKRVYAAIRICELLIQTRLSRESLDSIHPLRLTKCLGISIGVALEATDDSCSTSACAAKMSRRGSRAFYLAVRIFTRL